MAVKKASIVKLVEQGNTEALANSLNSKLSKIGVSVKASVSESCLLLMFEGESTPDQTKLVPALKKSLKVFESTAIQKAKLYGRKQGSDFPDWQTEIIFFEGDAPDSVNEQKEIVISSETSENGTEIVENANSTLTTESQNKAGFSFGGIGKFIGNTSQNIGSAASGLSQTALQSAAQAGQGIASTAVSAGKFVGSSTSHVTTGLGNLVSSVGDNPLFQQATKSLQVDWLVKLIDQVDLVKAETKVKELKEKHPDNSPSQIAHKLMLSKIGYTASSGFATSLVPGAAAPMMLVDLASTMTLQAEMAFQIAAAYDLDLQDPARKGEILAIFGLSAGGQQALKFGSKYAAKAGLGFLRNIPVAGAAIGASTNAAMTYALGYAACRFYEAKANPLSSESALEESQEASEAYLEEAVSQQVVMDQILVHVIDAGDPNRGWKEILPELKSISISPASLEVIEKNLESPPLLEELLENVNPDFAIPLVVQCKKAAKLDGVITPEEAKVLETIMKKLDVDLATILAE